MSFWHISGSNGKTESWCWLTLKSQCSNLTTQPTPWILALAYVWKWNDVFWRQPSIKTQLHIVSERQHNCSLYLETQKARREFYNEKSSQASIVKNLARPLLHTLKCKSTMQNPWEGNWVSFTEQRGKMSSLRLVLQQCSNATDFRWPETKPKSRLLCQPQHVKETLFNYPFPHKSANQHPPFQHSHSIPS